MPSTALTISGALCGPSRTRVREFAFRGSGPTSVILYGTQERGGGSGDDRDRTATAKGGDSGGSGGGMGGGDKGTRLATSRPLRTDVKTTSPSTHPSSPGRVDILHPCLVLVVLIILQVPACRGPRQSAGQQ
eukprot:4114516-Prymnesium_polylepis.1